MAYNHFRARALADRLVRKFGLSNGKIRRGTATRSCKIGIIQYTPREIRGGLVRDDAERAIVSAQGLTIPPSFEDQDIFLVKEGGVEYEYRMLAPAGTIKTGGIPLFWDCQVTRTTED